MNLLDLRTRHNMQTQLELCRAAYQIQDPKSQDTTFQCSVGAELQRLGHPELRIARNQVTTEDKRERPV